MVGLSREANRHEDVRLESVMTQLSSVLMRVFASLLELAEACDIPVRWSCRSGVCHSCECGIVDGELGYSPDPIDRPREGLALNAA
jgi:ferredoxin